MLSTTPPFVINKKYKIKERKKISKKESEIKTTLYWYKQRKYKVETKTNKEASKNK